MRTERFGKVVDDPQKLLHTVRIRLFHDIGRNITAGDVALDFRIRVGTEGLNYVEVRRRILVQSPQPEVVPGIPEAFNAHGKLLSDEVGTRVIAARRVGPHHTTCPEIAHESDGSLVLVGLTIPNDFAGGIHAPEVRSAEQ